MLRYAYFQTFKGGPTLLIWGAPGDLARLYEVLVQRADGEGPEVFADIAGSHSADGSSILLETVGESEGLRRDEVEPDVFHWRMERDGWFEFAEWIEPLAHQPSGHQYLRCHADDDIVVLVSSGEYPDDLMPSG